MEIKEEEKLIDELIKEDDNHTIKDFIELKNEILSILSTNDNSKGST